MKGSATKSATAQICKPLKFILQTTRQNIEKMLEKLIYKLLDTTSFNLRLNEELSKFKLISELLTHNNIPFKTWEPDGSLSLEIVEMSFSINCKFQDVYLLAYLLKDFGLENIYPSRKEVVEISVGTYLHQFSSIGKYALAEPMNIDSFLSIDPKSNTQFVVDSYFENQFSNFENDGDTENEYEKDRDSSEDQTDKIHDNIDLDDDQQIIEFWH
jgi:hypothetical protein